MAWDTEMYEEYEARKHILPASDKIRISDDDILSLWRTVQPSLKQDEAMTYQDGPHNLTCPTYELRRLVELAIEYVQKRR